MLGKTAEVLFEEEVKGRPGWMRGYAANYADVAAPVGAGAKGKIINIRLTEIDGENIMGIPV